MFLLRMFVGLGRAFLCAQKNHLLPHCPDKCGSKYFMFVANCHRFKNRDLRIFLVRILVFPLVILLYRIRFFLVSGAKKRG